MRNDDLIISDSVYGFVVVPNGLLRDIVEHRWFQRLGRIRQLGLAAYVYPGATHTRKEHSLGAFHLMQKAVKSMQDKGYFIFEQEEQGVLAAALLHDIGHGPMSHQTEGALIEGISHETFTRRMMEHINIELGGKLGYAIEIYKGRGTRPFLHELIGSQLDMDRLDYLCRDSYYTGVREGTIGADRIIGMLDIDDDHLVVKSKGIYTIENYLMARRLMYWQVYLHKTAVATERMLRSVIKRAKELCARGIDIPCGPNLKYLLEKSGPLTDEMIDDKLLNHYVAVDDNDIWCALKAWCEHSDKTLSLLSRGLVDRRLLKVDVYEGTHPNEEIENLKKQTIEKLQIPIDEVDYFVGSYAVKKTMYSPEAQRINLLFKSGECKELSEVSQIISSDKAAVRDSRVYVYHP